MFGAIFMALSSVELVFGFDNATISNTNMFMAYAAICYNIRALFVNMMAAFVEPIRFNVCTNEQQNFDEINK